MFCMVPVTWRSQAQVPQAELCAPHVVLFEGNAGSTGNIRVCVRSTTSSCYVGQRQKIGIHVEQALKQHTRCACHSAWGGCEDVAS